MMIDPFLVVEMFPKSPHIRSQIERCKGVNSSTPSTKERYENDR